MSIKFFIKSFNDIFIGRHIKHYVRDKHFTWKRFMCIHDFDSGRHRYIYTLTEISISYFMNHINIYSVFNMSHIISFNVWFIWWVVLMGWKEFYDHFQEIYQMFVNNWYYWQPECTHSISNKQYKFLHYFPYNVPWKFLGKTKSSHINFITHILKIQNIHFQ